MRTPFLFKMLFLFNILLQLHQYPLMYTLWFHGKGSPRRSHTCLRKSKHLKTKENNLSWSFNRYSLPYKNQGFRAWTLKFFNILKMFRNKVWLKIEKEPLEVAFFSVYRLSPLALEEDPGIAQVQLTTEVMLCASPLLCWAAFFFFAFNLEPDIFSRAWFM